MQCALPPGLRHNKFQFLRCAGELGPLFRYGVSWQYSGKDVQVRLHNGEIEIFYGEVLVAKHTAQYASGRILWFPGQYKGLAERNGIAAPYSVAQEQDIQVETRDLDFYDRLLGGVSYG